MTTNLLFRAAEGTGFCRAVGPGQAGLRYLDVGLLRLDAGDTYRLEDTDRETGLVLLAGRCAVRAEGVSWDSLGGRESIFDEPPTALYVPAGRWAEITALTRLEAAMGSAPAPVGERVVAVLPSSLTKRTVGRGSYSRSLYQVMFDNVPAKCLLVGETYNEPGGWSGYPPHKHDEDALPQESALEEAYLMKIDRKQGFGFIGIFDEAGLDEAYTVRDGDFIAVPKGYHPVANLPGQRLGYVWFMAGEKRTWVPRNHPAHPEV